jgi:hypothetical protein
MAGDTGGNAHARPVVVINEMLCFIVNKRRVMPDDAIVQLCKDYYKDEAVEDAKKTLFAHYADKEDRNDRYISRNGDGKKQKHIRDIIDLLTRKGIKNSVVFVAEKLTNMPCITYNDIDVSSLLLRMEQMETAVSQLKKAVKAQETVCADLHTITNDLSGTHQASLSEPQIHPRSTPRTGTFAAPHSSVAVDNNDGIATELSSQTVPWSDVVRRRRSPAGNTASSASAPVRPVKNRGTQQIVGKARDLAIKPAKKRVRLANVFASKLDPDLPATDLQSYLAGALSLDEADIMVEVVRRSEWHSSFHIKCHCLNPSVFMDGDIWPEDAYVRWWREPKQPTERKIPISSPVEHNTPPVDDNSTGQGTTAHETPVDSSGSVDGNVTSLKSV